MSRQFAPLLLGTAVLLAMGAALAPELALVLPLMLPLLALGLARPLWFFAGFILYGSLELFLTNAILGERFLLGRMASEAMLIGVSLLLIARTVMQRGRLRRTPLDLPLLLFLSVSIFSAFWNGVGTVPALLGLRTYLRFVIVYYAIVQLHPEIRQLRPLVWALVAVIVVQVTIGILQAVDPAGIRPFFFVESRTEVLGLEMLSRQTFKRTDLHTAIFGTMENYNNYGGFLATSIPILYGFWLARRSQASAWLVPALLASLVALALTGSRSSMLAFMAASVVSLVQLRKRWVLIVLLGALATIGYIMVTQILAQQGLIGQRLDPYSSNILQRWLVLIQPGTLEAGGNFRMYLMIEVGSWILTASPLIGLGIGTFGSIYSAQLMPSLYSEMGIPEHLLRRFIGDVNWVTIYAQTGFIGLLAFVGMLWRAAGGMERTPTARHGILEAHAISSGIRPMVMAAVVLGFFNPNFEARYSSFLLWVFLAAATVIRERGRAEKRLDSPASRAVDSEDHAHG